MTDSLETVRKARFQVVDLLNVPGLTDADRSDVRRAAISLEYVEVRLKARSERIGKAPAQKFTCPDWRSRQLPPGDR